ncbi:pogo transposable element with KRAB domain [Rhizophagus clarus]|uniref:Pogo transposable element with KRAB domain n=1 Tax=Rhizophagus clarus TaxID=94130 RepID=A0A8H3KSS1_9GLOM|nr:pogo transposable element with KRAB domain [Rhizophagus clarus]
MINRQVVDYAKNNGRNEAAKQFGLDSSMISRWVEASKSWVTELNQNCNILFALEQKNPSNYPIFLTWMKHLTENEKNRFTVILTCTADGTKFLLICIFKGKKLSRNERDLIPSGVIVWFQQNSWMDSNLMIDYVDYINESRTDSESKSPMMMIYVSFKGYLEESVKKKFHENGIDLAVIPGGLTSVCQLLDVAINKPFKDNLRKEWHLWMVNGDAGETSAGNLRHARLSDVCGWVKRSWNNIPDKVIIQSFKTCKISNSLNELIKYKFEMKSDKKNEEELKIDMHDLQASYEEITLENDPFFEIELNLTIYNDNEFVYSDESSLNNDK